MMGGSRLWWIAQGVLPNCKFQYKIKTLLFVKIKNPDSDAVRNVLNIRILNLVFVSDFDIRI
jgi:hypothetical protein